MKKFIRGAFELETGVDDLVAYENKHERAIKEIIEFADDFGIAINMGTTEDNEYLIEYKIVATTMQMCKGLLSDLKDMLKAEWKKPVSVWQGSGDILR